MNCRQLVFALVLSSIVVACSNQKAIKPTPGDAPRVEDRRVDNGESNALSDMSAQTRRLEADEAMAVLGQAIYFELDRYEVQASYKSLLEKAATYLKSHPQTRLLIQGNTDERGGREYNLGLGQKRANAVKQLLELLGVEANRLEAVSLGKEKPQCEAHTEECYSKNRRVDLVNG